MDIQSIAQLMRLLEESNLSALEVEQGDLRIRLEKGASGKPLAVAKAPVNTAAAPLPEPVLTVPAPAPAPAAQAAPVAQEPSKAGWKEIKSPMVGAFHVAKAEGKPVGIGTTLKKGATVCVIEAMKLMNDIVMPEEGEIVWAVAKEGELVEYGQLLFQYK